MEWQTFSGADLKQLRWSASLTPNKHTAGQVTIIAGSDLFHGAALLALKTASRLAGMVYFASTENSLSQLSLRLKGSLASFIWVPLIEVDHYIDKSDAVLIGPGMKRYRSEASAGFAGLDIDGELTHRLSRTLLQQHPHSHWVIDAGSLQVLSADEIPAHAILTPNHAEMRHLFASTRLNWSAFESAPDAEQVRTLKQLASQLKCVILYKNQPTWVTDGQTVYQIQGGNDGLNKGGMGDLLAGLITGLRAFNPPLLAAAASSYLLFQTAQRLYGKQNQFFNADDLADNLPAVLAQAKTAPQSLDSIP